MIKTIEQQLKAIKEMAEKAMACRAEEMFNIFFKLATEIEEALELDDRGHAVDVACRAGWWCS